MRAFFDWMATHVEPYVSFRWLVAALFGAMGVQALLALLLQLRDLTRSTVELAPREQQMARLLKRYALLLALRTLSFDTLRRHGGLIAQIVALAAAAIALNAWIFRLEA